MLRGVAIVARRKLECAHQFEVEAACVVWHDPLLLRAVRIPVL